MEGLGESRLVPPLRSISFLHQQRGGMSQAQGGSSAALCRLLAAVMRGGSWTRSRTGWWHAAWPSLLACGIK